MAVVQQHVLAGDVGGTHIGLAVFAYLGGNRFEEVHHETHHSRKTRDFAGLLRTFLRRQRRFQPAINSVCIDFAGPVGADRESATITNLDWGFSAHEVRSATGIENVTLMNDFEAIGYGFEVLLANRPEAFVRLTKSGKLPVGKGQKPTVVIIGAGTGLGTTILVHDSGTGRYRPVPGEGGHADFVALEDDEFELARWIRRNVNRSPGMPADCERVVSGPGLANVFMALSEIRAELASTTVAKNILKADPYDRPALIARSASEDSLCRATFDMWLRAYGRAAKNKALFPLTPGGVFLAGGIAAKNLPEMQSGVFLKEFYRCDVPNIRKLLLRTPVFVITDYNIGLYGCANVAVNGLV
jgi:glucokinase